MVVFTFTLDSARANPKLLCVSRGTSLTFVAQTPTRSSRSTTTRHDAPHTSSHPREANFECTRAIDEFTGEQGQRIGRCWVLAEDHSICDVPRSEAETRTIEDE